MPIPDTSNLIPEASALFDGSATKEDFVLLGNGFMWNSLVARARLKPQHAVLDIGSGNGSKARPLAAYLDHSGRYFGFDIVEEGIRWCRERYAGFKNFQFDFANLKSDWYNKDSGTPASEYVFPYASESIDVAFMSSVATHLLPRELENYLKQSFRVIKHGGCLLVTCYVVNQFNAGRHAAGVQGHDFAPFSESCYVIDQRSPSKGVAYDELYLRQLCADAGFVVAEMTFGTWANGVDRMAALQDTLLLIKR